MVFSELFKIIGIGLATVICYIIVKPIKPEMAIFISIIGSCIIFIFCIDSISNVIDIINNLIEKTGINGNLFLIILKVIGIGYLIEFSSNLCNEAGVSSISNKIELAGKVSILVLSIPIITNLLNIIIELLP